jgi:THO complex subunit 2
MTRMRFEQNKYNLFREANEGYSKIALQLLSLRDSDDVEKVEQSIICLIGNFDLDPDRVIDLILDGFIQNSGVKMYIKLLRKF